MRAMFVIFLPGMAQKPWNNWYHVTASTYGTWLRGDPRGWRSRHHREHVDGDYRNPPSKGKYDNLHELSKRLMKRDPVHIRRELRQIVVDEFVARLRQENIPVIVGSFDDHHFHGLIYVPDHRVRHFVGLAKKHTSHLLRQLKLLAPGGIWGKRCKPIPIKSRYHQLKVVQYILDHEKRGASICAMRGIKTRAELRRKTMRRIEVEEIPTDLAID
jgi:hypothetical protein